MNLRIALIGTHGTGKSTLAKEICKEYSFFENSEDNYSNAGKLFKAGLLKDLDPESVQLYLFAKHYFRVASSTSLVSDRSILDSLCYALHDFNRKLISKKVFLFLQEKSLEILNDHYDMLFWLRPEFQLEGEGKRPTDQKYQQAIDKNFAFYIENSSRIEIPVHTLTGSVEQRLQQAKQHISNYLDSLVAIKPLLWKTNSTY